MKVMRISKVCVAVLMIAMIAGSAQAVVTYETGFDQTGDVSGSNYTLGSIYNQNGWTEFGPWGSAGAGMNVEDGAFQHNGDGVMYLDATLDSGITRASGIDSSLPDAGDNAVIKLSMTIGTVDRANQGDLTIDCDFGTLMTWRKYQDAGSGPFSHASLTTAGNFTWGPPTGADIWAGGWQGWGPNFVNDAPWPYLNTTPENDYRTQLEITIWNTATETKIQYHALTPGMNNAGPYQGGFPGSNEVTSQEISLASKIADLRTFGNLTIQGHTGGYAFPVYVDDLKVEYVPEPATMLLLGLGSMLSLRRRRS